MARTHIHAHTHAHAQLDVLAALARHSSEVEKLSVLDRMASAGEYLQQELKKQRSCVGAANGASGADRGDGDGAGVPAPAVAAGGGVGKAWEEAAADPTPVAEEGQAARRGLKAWGSRRASAEGGSMREGTSDAAMRVLMSTSQHSIESVGHESVTDGICL